MTLRINDALALFNARQKQKGLPKLTKLELGEILFPESEYIERLENRPKTGKHYDGSRYLNNVKTAMIMLTNGGRQSIDVAKLQKLCEVLEVDSNFLTGQPSIHDKEFTKTLK